MQIAQSEHCVRSKWIGKSETEISPSKPGAHLRRESARLTKGSSVQVAEKPPRVSSVAAAGLVKPRSLNLPSCVKVGSIAGVNQRLQMWLIGPRSATAGQVNSDRHFCVSVGRNGLLGECRRPDRKRGVAQSEAEGEQWRVVIEDISAARGGCLVVVDRKLPDIASNGNRKMA